MTNKKYNKYYTPKAITGFLKPQYLNKLPKFDDIIKNIKEARIYDVIINYEEGRIYILAYDKHENKIYTITKYKDGVLKPKWYDVEYLNTYTNRYNYGLKLDFGIILKDEDYANFDPAILKLPKVKNLINKQIK